MATMPGQMAPPAMQSPAEEAAEGPEGANTVTINMTPGAITVTTPQGGTKPCASIGECLQTVLEAYEAMSSEGAEGDGEFENGYADQPQQTQRPISGVGVR